MGATIAGAGVETKPVGGAMAGVMAGVMGGATVVGPGGTVAVGIGTGMGFWISVPAVC